MIHHLNFKNILICIPLTIIYHSNFQNKYVWLNNASYQHKSPICPITYSKRCPCKLNLIQLSYFPDSYVIACVMA